MSGAPYYDSKDRCFKIRASWRGPNGLKDANKEFVLDSGASRTTIKESNADGIGLTVDVIVDVITPLGRLPAKLLLGGGTLEFDVIDSSANPKKVSYQGLVLMGKEDLIGNDVFTKLGLQIDFDYSVTPQTATLIG